MREMGVVAAVMTVHIIGSLRFQGVLWGEDGCMRYLRGMDDKKGLCLSKCNITI